MKATIEINFVSDGRIFFNFWDLINGNDVVAEFKNGKLYREILTSKDAIKEMSLQEFIDEVKEQISYEF